VTYVDYTVYITVIGGRGMQAAPWNGHSVEAYMEIPEGLTDEEIKNYVTESMIIEWRKQ